VYNRMMRFGETGKENNDRKYSHWFFDKASPQNKANTVMVLSLCEFKSEFDLV